MGTSERTVSAESSRTALCAAGQAPKLPALSGRLSLSRVEDRLDIERRISLLIRASHADAVVGDPCPVLYRVGLVDAPNASVDPLAVCRQARRAGNLMLAGCVAEAVSDLQLHRQ